MKSSLRNLVLSVLVAGVAMSATVAFARGGGFRPRPVIYVTGQQKLYDSIVTADPLPPEGPFQLLEPGGPTGLQTMYGPGDPGYVGGRWEVWDPDHPLAEADGYHYFSCPLLGPGRDEP
jgi:hypothetical protein